MSGDRRQGLSLGILISTVVTPVSVAGVLWLFASTQKNNDTTIVLVEGLENVTSALDKTVLTLEHMNESIHQNTVELKQHISVDNIVADHLSQEIKECKDRLNDNL